MIAFKCKVFSREGAELDITLWCSAQVAEAVATGKQKVERQSFSPEQLEGILSGQLRTATPIYSDPDVSAITQGQS